MDSKYLRFFVSLIGLVVAGYLATITITDFLGPFTAFCRIIGIGLMLIAILKPRWGMTIVFAELCYIDMLKRIAVFVDGPNFSITFQLLVIPVITIGLVTVFSLWKAFQEGELRQRHFIMTGLIGALGLALIFVFRESQGLMGGLKNAANIAAYATIVMLVDIHCKNLADIHRLLRGYLWILVPAALYTVYQANFGFQPFEIYYAKTGFTITANETLSDSPRAFGTFSAVSACAIYASAGALALWQMIYLPKRRWVAFLLAAAMIAAMIAARGRTTWVVFALTILSYPLLLSWKRLIIFYFAGLTAAFCLFWFSPYLYDNLRNINDQWLEIVQPKDSEDYKTFGLLTFSDRLVGLKNLRENPNFTWTGKIGAKLGLEDYNTGKDYYSHDGINQMIMSIGLIGLFFAAAFLISVTFYAHHLILGSASTDARRLGTFCMAYLVPFILSNLLAGSIIHVSPINFWMFMLIGMCFTCPRLGNEEALIEKNFTSMKSGGSDSKSSNGSEPDYIRHPPSRA